VPGEGGQTTIDELGMKRAIARIPAHLREPGAGSAGRRLPIAGRPDEVLVLGRSVAAHATEFVNAAFGPGLRAPVGIVPSMHLPDRIGSDSVVIAVALSPADDSVLQAAGAAAARGATVVVLASGAAPGSGRLARVALPAVPRERLFLYPVVAGMLGLLEAARMLDGTADLLAAAADRASARIEGPLPSRSLGEEIARRLGRTFPFLVGAPGVGLAAARWWQAEMAANARLLAHAESTSEYRDALLAGFGQSGDVTRQVVTLVLLRCPSDPPAAATVFTAIGEWLSEAVADIVTVEAEGSSPLAQLVDLALLGDLTSISLAATEGIDPGPAPVIDGQE
jgi:glucose/mannose-6-phosphate isomerase